VESHRRGPWTDAKKPLILAEFHESGPKAVHISTFLNDRREVKIRWHRHVSK
jgi:hypothetical protein